METHLYLYKLVDTEVLIRNQEMLKAALCYGQKVSDFDFFINPVSGWIRLRHKKNIHSDSVKKNLPTDSGKAREIAESYFRKVNEIMQNDRRIKESDLPLLFSMKLNHAYTSYVPHKDSPFADHWLSRFRIQLLHGLDTDIRYAEVLGAAVDIRIGDGGKIISLSYSFRPWTERKIISVDQSKLPDTKVEEEEEIHSHGETEISEPHNEKEPATASPASVIDYFTELFAKDYRIRYQMHGINYAQQYLSPDLSALAGHHLISFPLTIYTLNVRIKYWISGDSLELEAVVIGGSGNVEYEWAYWKIQEYGKGITTAGTSQTVIIPKDTFNVAIFARDSFTGETAQNQVMTFLNPGLERSPEPAIS